jgi:Flp pilus assembly protein TadG
MTVKSSGDAGASAVEFAIVLPILVLLIFGIIEFSVALYDKAMITNASREGARVGIVFRVPSVTDGEITNVVNSYLGSSLITFGAPVAANTVVTRTGYNPGDELKVTVNYTYTFLIIPSFVASLAGGINMVAETVMRME